MDPIIIESVGFIAGIITSSGWVPQLIRGYKTKKLEDVSYFMPGILGIGMSFWLIYGILIRSFAVVIANLFGVSCSLLLIIMKKKYS